MALENVTGSYITDAVASATTPSRAPDLLSNIVMEKKERWGQKSGTPRREWLG